MMQTSQVDLYQFKTHKRWLASILICHSFHPRDEILVGFGDGIAPALLNIFSSVSVGTNT